MKRTSVDANARNRSIRSGSIGLGAPVRVRELPDLDAQTPHQLRALVERWEVAVAYLGTRDVGRVVEVDDADHRLRSPRPPRCCVVHVAIVAGRADGLV